MYRIQWEHKAESYKIYQEKVRIIDKGRKTLKGWVVIISIQKSGRRNSGKGISAYKNSGVKWLNPSNPVGNVFRKIQVVGVVFKEVGRYQKMEGCLIFIL